MLQLSTQINNSYLQICIDNVDIYINLNNQQKENGMSYSAWNLLYTMWDQRRPLSVLSLVRSSMHKLIFPKDFMALQDNFTFLSALHMHACVWFLCVCGGWGFTSQICKHMQINCKGIVSCVTNILSGSYYPDTKLTISRVRVPCSLYSAPTFILFYNCVIVTILNSTCKSQDGLLWFLSTSVYLDFWPQIWSLYSGK